MTDPITFLANISAVQAGDDEIRLTLAVLDTDKDRAAAVQMVGCHNRVLHVSAYQQTPGQEWDQLLVEFRCSIAQLKAAVVISPKRPPTIKFDIPASDGINALRLVGYDEKVIRFEVSDEGAAPKKEPKPKKEKAKTPFGDLWQELLYRNMGFEFIAGVKETLEEVRSSAKETPHDLMHKVFNVKSLSDLIGRDEIYAKWPPNEYPAVGVLVQQALDRIENRQAKQQTQDCLNGNAVSHVEDPGDGFPPDMFFDDSQEKT
jgi:hypothetical protein